MHLASFFLGVRGFAVLSVFCALADEANTGCWPVLKAVFPRIDRDGNGFLLLAKIDQAVADPQFRGVDAAGVVTLRRDIRTHKSGTGP